MFIASMMGMGKRNNLPNKGLFMKKKYTYLYIGETSKKISTLVYYLWLSFLKYKTILGTQLATQNTLEPIAVTEARSA